MLKCFAARMAKAGDLSFYNQRTRNRRRRRSHSNCSNHGNNTHDGGSQRYSQPNLDKPLNTASNNCFKNNHYGVWTS